MHTKPNLFACEENENPSLWWLMLKVSIMTALAAWIMVNWLNKKRLQIPPVALAERPDEIPLPVEDDSTPEVGASAPIGDPRAPQTETHPPVQPDNLRKIEGIGPKIESILKESGILTFQQLANTQPAEIKDLLTAAGLRLGDPATWPEQAALAAVGEWDELKRLQATLKGGRRV